MCTKQLVWVVACIVMFGVALTLNYLSTTGNIKGTSQTELSDKYSLPITPPGWTFSIWGIIYLWQGAWLIYILYHSIKYSTELKSKNILTFGKWFYISWILSCIFNGAWIILFSWEEITISAIILISISISLYINGYINHKYIGLAMKNAEGTQSEYPSYLTNNRTTIIIYRILLLNGIAFYGTWCSIAQCLNIAIFFTYIADIYVYTSTLIALCILTAVILTYWFFDFYYLRSWLIYTYSPYAVLLWAISAVSTNPNEGELALKGASRVWIYVLLIMVAIATVCKIISGICYKPNDDERLNKTNIQQNSTADVDVQV